MNRGFTLLELLITLVVLALLISWAAPSYKAVTESSKMKRLAAELHGIVLLGKSQAVLRRERLWAHVIMSGVSSADGQWKIELTDNETPGSGDVLQKLDGNEFRGLVVEVGYASNQISFDDVHGRPSSGNIKFHPIASADQSLKLISHTQSARVRVCSDSDNNENFYGFALCN
ncbi:pilus assembly FimT family protein [Vibrio agarivorans]|uniref:pilus assembly FimT family protein n=1 Tax=Vibrio agarivorans TaxID=153622 RepID=UPI0025B324A1|nr:GspH/FimT family pseudopilin [Vibrio agarivorans]MDN3661401.1 GspH/FimT family pseudopilin [Vibrio agarivorans]